MIDETTLDFSNYFEQTSPDVIRVKGHRIGIEHILKYYLEGYQPEEISMEIPGLSLEKIYAAITLYLANKKEINNYLERRRKRDLKAYNQWVSDSSDMIERLRVVREQQEKYS